MTCRPVVAQWQHHYAAAAAAADTTAAINDAITAHCTLLPHTRHSSHWRLNRNHRWPSTDFDGRRNSHRETTACRWHPGVSVGGQVPSEFVTSPLPGNVTSTFGEPGDVITMSLSANGSRCVAFPVVPMTSLWRRRRGEVLSTCVLRASAAVTSRRPYIGRWCWSRYRRRDLRMRALTSLCLMRTRLWQAAAAARSRRQRTVMADCHVTARHSPSQRTQEVTSAMHDRPCWRLRPAVSRQTSRLYSRWRWPEVIRSLGTPADFRRGRVRWRWLTSTSVPHHRPSSRHVSLKRSLISLSPTTRRRSQIRHVITETHVCHWRCDRQPTTLRCRPLLVPTRLTVALVPVCCARKWRRWAPRSPASSCSGRCWRSPCAPSCACASGNSVGACAGTTSTHRLPWWKRWFERSWREGGLVLATVGYRPTSTWPNFFRDLRRRATSTCRNYSTTCSTTTTRTCMASGRNSATMTSCSDDHAITPLDGKTAVVQYNRHVKLCTYRRRTTVDRWTVATIITACSTTRRTWRTAIATSWHATGSWPE